MIKYITLSVIAVFTQIIALIMWGEFVWLYRFANGGVGGTPIEQIQPIFWWIMFIEVIILVSLGAVYKKNKS